MAAVTLIARKPHVFAGHRRKPGDRYKASEAHARVLVALKHADYAPAERPAPQPPPPPPEPERPKRPYRKRELRIEDEITPPVAATVIEPVPVLPPDVEVIRTMTDDIPESEPKTEE